MKWKNKHIPKHGEIRIRRVFALIPRRCTDGITRWLCNVLVVEEYNTIVCSNGFYPSWSEYATSCEDTPENIQELKIRYSHYLNNGSTKV